MKRMFAIAAAAVIMGSGLVSAGAASAEPSCSSGAACWWRDIHYVTSGNQAKRLQFQLYIPRFSVWNYSGTNYSAQDSASSSFNNGTGGERAYGFYNAYCGGRGLGGPSFSMATNHGDSDFTNGSPSGPFGTSFNDKVSSGAFATLITSCKSA